MPNREQIEELRRESAGLDTAAFVAWAAARFPGAAFATSLGAEDQALLWLIERAGADVAAFSLDTGRLPGETYELLQANREFFGTPIRSYAPDAAALEELLAAHGPNLFYRSLELRKACCAVRKVAPLRRALAGRPAWFTGMRRGQSGTRGGLERVEWDDANGLYKLNPLADWSAERVWALIRAEGIPYNALHDRGYPSLGCAPCTRAVAPGEDERAGRWWWEAPEHKECGLHVHGGPAGDGPAGDGPRKTVGGIGALNVK